MLTEKAISIHCQNTEKSYHHKDSSCHPLITYICLHYPHGFYFAWPQLPIIFSIISCTYLPSVYPFNKMAVHIFLYIFQFNVFIVNYTEFPVRPSDTRDRGEVLTSPKLNNFIQSYSCLVKVKSQVYRVIVRFYFLFVCLLQKKNGSIWKCL